MANLFFSFRWRISLMQRYHTQLDNWKTVNLIFIVRPLHPFIPILPFYSTCTNHRTKNLSFNCVFFWVRSHGPFFDHMCNSYFTCNTGRLRTSTGLLIITCVEFDPRLRLTSSTESGEWMCLYTHTHKVQARAFNATMMILVNLLDKKIVSADGIQ